MKSPYTLLCFLLLMTNFSIQAQEKPIVETFLSKQLQDFPSVRDFTLSPEGNEAYFTAQSYLNEVSVILVTRKVDNVWSEPKITTFSGKYHDLEPFLSPDGLRLYFVSNRPMDSSSVETKDYDIWYVERGQIEEPWSTSINMGAPVNSSFNEFYPSVSNNNNLYFTCDLPTAKGKDDIFLCTWKNGAYETPISLSDSINTMSYEFNSYIAPDESFLIFSGYNREDGLGSGDLYISRKNKEGEWLKAVNMGSEINSKQMDYCPFVDVKTNTLYFTSKRSEIEDKARVRRPSQAIGSPSQTEAKGFQSIEELKAVINGPKNGQSRLYFKKMF